MKQYYMIKKITKKYFIKQCELCFDRLCKLPVLLNFHTALPSFSVLRHLRPDGDNECLQTDKAMMYDVS